MPDDARTIDATLAALHEIISGPPGHRRDWDRFRRLFTPDARLVASGRDEADGPSLRSMTVDQFIPWAERTFLAEGCFECEVDRRLETCGRIAHAWSRFESRREPTGPTFAEGMNSFQLVEDSDGWRIVAILWEAAETE